MNSIAEGSDLLFRCSDPLCLATNHDCNTVCHIFELQHMLQVLEILNDKEVRSLSETGQSKVFGGQPERDGQSGGASSWWYKKAAVAS